MRTGGTYSVHNPDFLTGANISVCLTKEFMQAVENDEEYELRFPDVETYSEEEMRIYNEKWHEVGDVREWEKMGYRVRVYRKFARASYGSSLTFAQRIPPNQAFSLSTTPTT